MSEARGSGSLPGRSPCTRSDDARAAAAPRARPIAAARPQRRALRAPAAGDATAGPQRLPGSAQRTCSPALTPLPEPQGCLRHVGEVLRRAGWARADPALPARPPSYLLDEQGRLQPRAPPRRPGPEPLPRALHRRDRGPRAPRSRPLRTRSVHTAWWWRSLASRAWQIAEQGAGRGEGREGRERGTGRAQGSGHLVLLQGRSDLAEIRAQGRILHQLSPLPQPGVLLLTAVQELCPLQGLLQQGPPEGQQGPHRGSGSDGAWGGGSPGGPDTPP